MFEQDDAGMPAMMFVFVIVGGSAPNKPIVRS
jgi:hypothetical protein